MFVGVLLGQQQFARAWDDCRARAPIVRTALVDYHARNGGYPARLEELPIELPCRCGFRDTILHYLSNERGFKLWITNDREIVATATALHCQRKIFRPTTRDHRPRHEIASCGATCAKP